MVRVLLRSGFEELRQKGSHRIFGKENRRAIVPMHSGDLKPGTLEGRTRCSWPKRRRSERSLV